MLRLFAAAPAALAFRAPPDGSNGTLGAAIVGSHELGTGAVAPVHMADMPAGSVLGRVPGEGGGPPRLLGAAEALRVVEEAARERVFPRRADAQSVALPAAADRVRLLGRRTSGDRGAAVFVRRTVEPSHPGKMITADGTWWEIDEPVIRPEMFAAWGDGQSDDTAAIRNAVACCAAQKVPLLLDAPEGYAISGEILISSPNFIMRGSGTGGPTLRALAPEARVAVAAVRECRIEQVNFDGRHPATGEWTATNAFVTLTPQTALPAANSFLLDRCRGEFTRGPAVRIGRDATETRIWGGTFGKCGRVDATKTGAARFVDGHVPVIDWRGNGSLIDAVLAGATGHCLEMSSGPADALGVYEEVHCRALNVRLQNGFLGLVWVRDWENGAAPRLASTASEIPVQLNWLSGYMENPGTIQDSTTTGGSSVTQGSGDDVVCMRAEGEMVRVSVDAPIKILSRRARAAFRARLGARIEVNHRGLMLAAQQLGNTSDVRTIWEADAQSAIRVRSLPSLFSAESGDHIADDPHELTQLGVSAGGDPRRGVIPSGLSLLRTVVDGSTAAAVAATAAQGGGTHAASQGVASVTVSAAQGTWLTGGSSLRATCSADGAAAASWISVPVELPAHWVGLTAMAACTFRHEQAAGWSWGDLRHRLWVFDATALSAGAPAAAFEQNAVSDPAGAIFPIAASSVETALPSPGGAGARTDWQVARAFFQVRRPGTAVVRFAVDARAALHRHIGYIDSIRLYALDGEGPGES